MAVSVTARTPGTALRKLWEVIHHTHFDSFAILSGMRGTWAIDPATASARSRKQDPHEYVGEPDASRDAGINKVQDTLLQRYLRSLGLPVTRLDGLGQELRTVIDDLTKEARHVQYSAHETSYLIAGLSEVQAQHLCTVFNQDFFIFGAKDQSIRCIDRDPDTGAFSNGFSFDSAAFYKGKSFDPKQGPGGSWVKDDPGSATYRSDAKSTPGVGFTFYNEGDVAGAIEEAAKRLIATKQIATPLAKIERAWMEWSRDIETKVRQLEEDGDTQGAEQARTEFKNVVRQASKNPEDMVRFLIDQVIGQPAPTPVAEGVV